MHCFFHLVDNHRSISDDTGIEVQNLDTAKTQALRAIGALRQESGEMAEDCAGWRLDGSLLHSISLTRALHLWTQGQRIVRNRRSAAATRRATAVKYGPGFPRPMML